MNVRISGHTTNEEDTMKKHFTWPVVLAAHGTMVTKAPADAHGHGTTDADSAPTQIDRELNTACMTAADDTGQSCIQGDATV